LVLLGVMGVLIGGPINIITSAVAIDLVEDSAIAGRNDLITVTGIINGCGSIMASLGLVVVGPLSTAYGWKYVWYLLMFCTLLGTLLMMPVIVKEFRLGEEIVSPAKHPHHSHHSHSQSYQHTHTTSSSEGEEVQQCMIGEYEEREAGGEDKPFLQHHHDHNNNHHHHHHTPTSHSLHQTNQTNSTNHHNHHNHHSMPDYRTITSRDEEDMGLHNNNNNNHNNHNKVLFAE